MSLGGFVSLVVIIVLIALVVCGYVAGTWEWGGTGFNEATLWDWLKLAGVLAVPVVVTVGGFWLNRQQRRRELESQEVQRSREQRAERQRHERELEIVAQRAQDAALQAYIDQMGLLLMDKNLRGSSQEDEVRVLARAQTLTVLGRLDPSRKRSVLQFLYEARLISTEGREGPIISLRDADLSRADLSGMHLYSANLERANLSGADLSDAELSLLRTQGGVVRTNTKAGATGLIPISASNLIDADIRGASLVRANLAYVDFVGADLTDADLTGAKLHEDKLHGNKIGFARSLKGATMPDGSKHE